MMITNRLIITTTLLTLGLTAYAKEIELTTQSGYRTIAVVIQADDNKKDIGLVMMHGKAGTPFFPLLQSLADDLADQGYDVILPMMVWSKKKRNGTLNAGMEIIDEAVKYISKRFKYVVVSGHSLGGVEALIYASRTPPENVIGVISISTGHMPQYYPRLLNYTSGSLAKAKQMAANGELKDTASFKDVNVEREFDIEATAEFYLDFYDPTRFPDIKKVLPKIKIPALWIIGENDLLRKVYDYDALYKLQKKHPKNKLTVLSGNHKTVLNSAEKTVANWLNNLASP